MLRIKPYLGSKSTEDYLNKKAQKGYELESITSFRLFVPLRLDAFSFKKTLKTKRVYRVDSRKIKKEDFMEYQQIFKDDGWEYFKNNFANDEYNSDYIFYSENSTKNQIFSDSESEKLRNKENAASSLYKGIFLFMVFLFFSIIFPSPLAGNNSTLIGFIFHNIYIIVSIFIIIISLIRYLKSR